MAPTLDPVAAEDAPPAAGRIMELSSRLSKEIHRLICQEEAPTGNEGRELTLSLWKMTADETEKLFLQLGKQEDCVCEEVDDEEREQIRTFIQGLRTLNLDRNNLKSFPWRALEVMPNLETLVVTRNLLRPSSLQVFIQEESSYGHTHEEKECEGGSQAPPAPPVLDRHTSDAHDIKRIIPRLCRVLPSLRVLDLRFNKRLGCPLLLAKLHEEAAPYGLEIKMSLFGQLEGARPADRDAQDLRAQLEPHPTRVLRRRLAQMHEIVDRVPHEQVGDGECKIASTTNQDVALREDEDNYHDKNGYEELEREEVMCRLLDCYQRGFERRPSLGGKRFCDRFYGTPVEEALCAEMLEECRRWVAAEEKKASKSTRERPSIKAAHYMILRRSDVEVVGVEMQEDAHRTTPAAVGSTDPQSSRLDRFEPSTAASRKQARFLRKQRKHQAVWDVARRIVESVDPEFASTQWTQLAVTHNFEGSPHIDKQNTGFFYAIAVGDFGRDRKQEDIKVTQASSTLVQPEKDSTMASITSPTLSTASTASQGSPCSTQRTSPNKDTLKIYSSSASTTTASHSPGSPSLITSPSPSPSPSSPSRTTTTKNNVPFNGGLCVEHHRDPWRVISLNSKNRLAKVDGRYPHWVAPWHGKDRFSFVFYQTEGSWQPPEEAAWDCGVEEDEEESRT
ncbi:unnamed protein product [Amoebophrya sp. A25]|nr:unnamed protein product [Amoebophrya sp. A25]|eukprot:GSA25T00021829001.1